jgi:hypothetical protein
MARAFTRINKTIVREGRYGRPALLCALIAAAFTAAPPATASTASVEGFDLFALNYQAEAGEKNHVTFTYSADVVRVTDTGATITPGNGCTATSAHEVDCTPVDFVQVATGDLDDFVTMQEMDLNPPGCVGALNFVDGGDGDDL